MKEKLFIALAWLPKATVQAALGPVALGKAREALAALLAARAEAGHTGDCGEVEDMDQGQSSEDLHQYTSL